MSQNMGVASYLASARDATLPMSLRMAFSQTHGKTTIHNFVHPSEYIYWDFPRNEVYSNRIGSSVDRLMELTDTTLQCHQMQGRLLLRFADTENDPREIHEIPECVDFLRQVHQQWPYWLHFMAPAADNLNILLLMLCDSATLHQGRDIVRAQLTNLQQARSLVQNLHRSMAVLHAHIGLERETSLAISLRFNQLFEKMLAQK